MLWRWTKTTSSRQLSERFRKSGNTDSRDWKRLKGSRSCERFFVDILLEQADLYSLVFFLDIQTFYQVLFAQVYSVRLAPIYLFFSYQDSFVNMIRTRVKISKIFIITVHISIFRVVMTTDLPLPCFCITHAAFHVFHHYIGQKQVAFPD